MLHQPRPEYARRLIRIQLVLKVNQNLIITAGRNFRTTVFFTACR